MNKNILIILLGFACAVAQQTDALIDTTAAVQQTDSPIDTLVVETQPAAADTLRQLGQPLNFMHTMFVDTSQVDGAAYYSFGDIAETLNSVYYYHPGSMGQQNYVSLFSGRAGQFDLAYDGLLLNDAFTGLADLNVIPAENVGTMQIQHHALTNRAGLWQPNGVQVNSLDIADLPIRSQVGYRNGVNAYNDVDARIGIRPSVRTHLNFGATARSTNGTMTESDAYGNVLQNSSYNAYNADVKYDRQLSQNWSGHYVLHAYKGNTHFPLISSELYPDLVFPMEKKDRLDHGFIFRYKNNIDLAVQKTKQRNTWHGQEHKIINEWYNADIYRAAALAKVRWKLLGLQSGLQFKHYNFSRKDIGRFKEWQAEAFENLMFESDLFTLDAGVTANGVQDNSTVYVNPHVRILVNPSKSIRLLAFAHRNFQAPSYHARFSTGPLLWGNRQLEPETTDRFATTIEYKYGKISAYLTGAQEYRTNMIAAIAFGDSAAYQNMPEHSVLSLSAGSTIEFFPEFYFVAKANYFSQQNFTPANQPDYFAKCYVQYRRVFFQNDLDITLRVGASVVGLRIFNEPYWADFSDVGGDLSESVDPYVNATIVIGSVSWFVSMENYAATSYSRSYPYLMPAQAFRFGFVWNFID